MWCDDPPEDRVISIVAGCLANHDRAHSLDKTKNKCGKCECCLEGKKYDIDHVRPLSNGGTNELHNLQVLCKACHQDKTANEQENGQFVKF